MLPVSQVTGILEAPWFNSTTAPYALVDSALRIRAVNGAYERVTAHPRDALIGEFLFDAFPDNPADPHADGVANASDSMESVLRYGIPHWMGVQRYDVPDRDSPGEFTFKVWAPVNAPVKVRGNTVGVLHHVQDVTDQVPPPARPAPSLAIAELSDATDALRSQFPEVPFEELLGVITHSHQVVMKALGTADIERSRDLARLRLEVRAGRPARSDDA